VEAVAFIVVLLWGRRMGAERTDRRGYFFAMGTRALETDYLVVGAGAAGMACARAGDPTIRRSLARYAASARPAVANLERLCRDAGAT